MIIALALASAVVFGAGDFCGGAASRRGGPLRVPLVSLPTGLVMLLVVALLGGGSHPAALGWGTASGVAGGAGLLVFYRALADGPMSVVAPVSGLMAAVIPAAAGVASGDHLSYAAFAGITLCLVAICFVSMEKDTGSVRRWRGPALAVFAGTGFGGFFVLIQHGDDGTLWPLVMSKSVGVLMVVVAAAVARQGPTPLLRDRITLGVAVLAGTLDVLGNALFVLASRAGMLSVAGVLSSLYPASTVLLARLVYGERLRPIQRLGLVVAVAGVGLVTTG
jgi:drug/metabolite transporter (DMT)-like permease